MRAVDRIRVWWHLHLHRLYLRDSCRYARFRARLVRMDLRGIDLHGHDLRRVRFIDSDLRGADFSYADLSGCDFDRTDLSNAYLKHARIAYGTFLNARMEDTECPYAKFEGVRSYASYMRGCSFRNATLRDCTFADGTCLRDANFSDATLSGVELSDTDVTDARFHGTSGMGDVRVACTVASFQMACPEKGAFTAFKKVRVGVGDVIAELSVPAHALRSSVTSRKCRVSEAVVVALELPDGTPYDGVAHSQRDFGFEYRKGCTVRVPDFDPNRWHECSPGIHCFTSRADAVAY